MIQFLQSAAAVDSLAAETVKETAEAVKNGDFSYFTQFIEQCIGFCVEGGKSILVACVIFFVGRAIISAINKVVAKTLERRKVEASIQSFLRSFVNILLTILLIITVVSALGVNTTSFAALLASAGVAVGMALSGNLQNLAGGLIILLFKPFRVGDFVDAMGVSGVVKEIQIFHTILQTGDNKLIYLPNGALSNGSVVNYSHMAQRRVDLTIGVEYGEDVEKVKAALLELIAANPLILKDPAPFVAVSSLSASSVDFVVRMWVNAADYWTVFFGMQETIYTDFNKRGIGFPFPQLTVHQGK